MTISQSFKTLDGALQNHVLEWDTMISGSKWRFADAQAILHQTALGLGGEEPLHVFGEVEVEYDGSNQDFHGRVVTYSASRIVVATKAPGDELRVHVRSRRDLQDVRIESGWVDEGNASASFTARYKWGSISFKPTSQTHSAIESRTLLDSVLADLA